MKKIISILLLSVLVLSVAACKKEDNTSLLGSKIDIIYKDVNKPSFSDNTLIVKDDIMLEKWYKKKAKRYLKYI